MIICYFKASHGFAGEDVVSRRAQRLLERDAALPLCASRSHVADDERRRRIARRNFSRHRASVGRRCSLQRRHLRRLSESSGYAGNGAGIFHMFVDGIKIIVGGQRIKYLDGKPRFLKEIEIKFPPDGPEKKFFKI
jgi:hypothetical protein